MLHEANWSPLAKRIRLRIYYERRRRHRYSSSSTSRPAQSTQRRSTRSVKSWATANPRSSSSAPSSDSNTSEVTAGVCWKPSLRQASATGHLKRGEHGAASVWRWASSTRQALRCLGRNKLPGTTAPRRPPHATRPAPVQPRVDQQVLAQSQVPSVPRRRGAAHHLVGQQRERTLVGGGEALHERLAGRHRQHAISQKLEALVALQAGGERGCEGGGGGLKKNSCEQTSSATAWAAAKDASTCRSSWPERWVRGPTFSTQRVGGSTDLWVSAVRYSCRQRTPCPVSRSTCQRCRSDSGRSVLPAGSRQSRQAGGR